MEIKQARKEAKELEETIFKLIEDFCKRADVRVTNIQVQEDYFTAASSPKILGIKIYTTID